MAGENGRPFLALGKRRTKKDDAQSDEHHSQKAVAGFHISNSELTMVVASGVPTLMHSPRSEVIERPIPDAGPLSRHLCLLLDQPRFHGIVRAASRYIHSLKNDVMLEASTFRTPIFDAL
jgi:hypothetical protein